jgi:regulator of protease activity HflC (stomatin/prohibitin superfamily)
MIALLVSAASVLVLPAVVRRVPAGHVQSLHRRGCVPRMLEPGLHLVLPGLDRLGHRIDLTGQVLQFQDALADTCGVCGKVYWQVLEPERIDPVIDQADQLIRLSTLRALHEEADPGHGDHRALGSRLKRVLNGVLRERGVMVTRVELDFA